MEAAGIPVPRFFSAEQFSTLERLGEILMPPTADRPGSKQAGAAAFLDTLIAQSPKPRQELYSSGLNALNKDARAQYKTLFPELSAAQAERLLAPLRAPWTYDGPSDPYARFLLSAKEDFLRATINSRAWAQAVSKTGRGGSGTGTYWLSPD